MRVGALRDCSLGQLEDFRGALSEQTARRCRFIIEESARVLDLSDALPAGRREVIAGLCAESFRGATELYEIVSPPMLAMMGAMLTAPGIIGARQAGAGFGGCMVAFVDAQAIDAFSNAVCSHYLRATGIEPQIYPVEAAPGASVLKADSMEVEV
jgi:galactokinase